jgi:phosphatidylglycerophosphate synthase
MTDSWLDRVVHRRLSKPLSVAAVNAGIGPNLITLASLAVGLGGAWCVAGATAGGAALGLALYLAAVVLDHADGEVARRTGTESRLGHGLDIAVDTAVHAALVVAMGAAASRLAIERGIVLGVLAAAGVVASAAVAQAWPPASASRRPAPNVAGLLESLGNRHGFYALLLAFVSCLAVAPGLLPALLVVAAVGSHAYWLGRVAVGLAGRGRAPLDPEAGLPVRCGGGSLPAEPAAGERTSDAAALCAGLPALAAMLALAGGAAPATG